MGIFDFFKNLFKKDKDTRDLRENPVIYINCIEKYENGFFLGNPEDKKDVFTDSNIEDDRTIYYVYPNDVDQTLEENDQFDILNTKKDVIVSRGFTWDFPISTSRTVKLFVPKNMDHYKTSLKETRAGKFLMRGSELTRREIDNTEILRESDIHALTLYKKTMPLLEAKMFEKIDRIIADFNKDTDNLVEQVQHKSIQ